MQIFKLALERTINVQLFKLVKIKIKILQKYEHVINKDKTFNMKIFKRVKDFITDEPVSGRCGA